METAMRADAVSSVSRILEAAHAVFARGDGSGTLARIAHEAGVGIATLYRHFPSREVLARAVYDGVFEREVVPLLAGLERAEAPRAALLDLVERLADIAARERGLASSLEDLAQATAELLGRHAAVFARALELAQRAGNIRPDIVAADVPRLLALMSAGLGVLDGDRGTRRRYLSLFLDALNPARATRLPA